MVGRFSKSVGIVIGLLRKTGGDSDYEYMLYSVIGEKIAWVWYLILLHVGLPRILFFSFNAIVFDACDDSSYIAFGDAWVKFMWDHLDLKTWTYANLGFSVNGYNYRSTWISLYFGLAWNFPGARISWGCFHLYLMLKMNNNQPDVISYHLEVMSRQNSLSTFGSQGKMDLNELLEITDS